jgi:hypothetical protein
MQTYTRKICVCCYAPYIGTGRAQRWCAPCGKIRTTERRHEEWIRNPRRQLHGLSQSQYDELRLLGCAICKQSFVETPHIDHDHRHCSGKVGCKECVRGLLCRVCNNGFIYAIEMNPSLRTLVPLSVLDYVDKIKNRDATSSFV